MRVPLAAVPVFAAFVSIANAQATPIAIVGGTVLTMAGPAIDGGTVVMRGGKLVAVGAHVAVPNGATIVDAKGKYVMPGIVDAATYFGVDPQDLNETSNPVTPELRIIDEYDPTGQGFAIGAGPIHVDELLSGGVTTQHVGPGDATVVGGQGVVVKTAGPDRRSLILREPASLAINVGAGPNNLFRSQHRTPTTHLGTMALLRQDLIRAQEYDRAWQRYDAEPEAERAKSPPTRNLGTDVLVQLLHRKFPARIQANTVTDIHGAMALADTFNFDLIIDGGAQAYEIADELAARKIPVILGPISHPYISGEVVPDHHEYPAPTEADAALLSAAGVKIAIASYAHGSHIFPAITGKWLLIDAGIAAGYGLPKDETLRALTIYPAQILGVAKRVGSLEIGKDADVLVVDGPPLSIKSWVNRVYVNGELVHTRPR